MSHSEHSHYTPSASPLVEQVREYVLYLSNQHSDPRLVFHNFHRASRTAALADELGQAARLPAPVVEHARVAAWFYITGYLTEYAQPHELSRSLAKSFLQKQAFPDARIQAVLHCLRTAEDPSLLETPESSLFLDALHGSLYGSDFAEQAPLWRMELELLQHRSFQDSEWPQFLVQRMMEVRYLTGPGKERFQDLLARHLLQKKEALAKAEARSAFDGAPFRGLERKPPFSATQTFFRTNYRNHINLSSIADNKANIMISVNAILISVMISIVSYRNLTETNPMILMPVMIFLMTGLASLVFAVLSARPKVTQLNKRYMSKEEQRKNIVFFGNFVHMPLSDYEEALDAMFRDSELLYGNLARDLYYLGKVLDKKYRYLTISYNIFMVGFVATVLTLMAAISL
jgi:hypothetical protein